MQFETPPHTLDELHARIEEISPHLPKRLIQCAEYLAGNPERIAMATVADLSNEAGVAPSAMMRFCNRLGFEGFSQMQSLFRDAMSNRLPDYATRIAKLRESESGSPAALLAEFVHAGTQSLENMASNLDQSALQAAIDGLVNARTIHIMAFPVASYMAYALEKMEISAVMHAESGSLSATHTLLPDDAIIAITFAPYSDETLAFAEAAHRRGLPVVMITDNKADPAIRNDYLPVIVQEVDFGAFRSLSATLAVAITIAVSIGTKRNKPTSRNEIEKLYYIFKDKEEKKIKNDVKE